VRLSLLVSAASATTLGVAGLVQAPKHLNPMIDLHAAKKPVFGLYAPANPRVRPGGAGGPGGAAPVVPAAAVATKTPAQLAADALAYTQADFIFDGSMEGDFDRGYAGFAEFVKAIADAGPVAKTPYAHLHHPIAVKTHEIAEDTALAKQRIAKQLDLGVSTVVFVGVESAAEVKTGLAAMRFASKGGTRPDQVGVAPAMWGMTPKAYKEKADLWPLNPNGELTNWTIVESKEGLKHVREIAAVKGISVLFPGAGTLRGVFTTVDSTTKERKFDAAGWEGAIQQVLAACKEFDVPCGYPANDPQTVEERMKQGFSVFIAGWGDNGFKAVEYGKKASGR
jgi:2-keto-3-deoxy-L-rhamnonate aldolase RhmA